MSKSLKQKKAIVISKSGNKTVKVSVKRRIIHKKYKKVINKTWTILAHDELNSTNVGDEVVIVPCRPLSALKNWRVLSQRN